MQLEVGKIVEGRVTGITNFGAFISLPEGKTGMIHISEMSNSYVKDINDFLEDGKEVKVEVLSVADDGKIALSIKNLQEENGIKPPEERQQREAKPSRQQGRPSRRREEDSKPAARQPGPPEDSWRPRSAQNNTDTSFEDMLTKFKQTSNDRISDLKRSQEPQRSRNSGGGGRS